MLSAGALIWISCRPLIRLMFCTACGFIITKLDLFPAVAARGAGQVILNITLPSLMFSKIVPAFTAQNASALGEYLLESALGMGWWLMHHALFWFLGPLILVAFLYEGIGIALAWIISRFVWVPHRFRYGFLVAGGWGNTGDIPTSVVMSVTGAAPFVGDDQNLAVAYIATFIFIFMVTLFPMGGHKLVAMDYVGPNVENEEVRHRMRVRRQKMFSALGRFGRLSKRRQDHSEVDSIDVEKSMGISHAVELIPPATEEVKNGASLTGPDSSSEICPQSRVGSLERTATMTAVDTEHLNEKGSSNTNIQDPATPTQNRPVRKLWQNFKDFLRALLSPVSVAIFAAFPIALIPDLKALLVPNVPGTSIPPAPDGEPPLAFLLDATTFMGNASVPLGLVCLGSALARLPIPRKGQWGGLPLGAIGSLAVAKMLVMPVLGVLICQGLTNIGVISATDRVLRFVCMFCACLPTSTTQVFLTQVYSGTGTAGDLSTFLIPQYIIMFFSMTAITAYSIQLLF